MIYLKIILVLLVGFSAEAANRKIEIDSKLFIQGRKIASPRILANEGKKSKIIMNDQKQDREYNLEVFPELSRDKKINLRYRLAIKERKNETISRGLIKIKNNKAGLIYLDGGRIQIHLKVKRS